MKITNDYQDLILKHEGMTREQWEKNPGIYLELNPRILLQQYWPITVKCLLG